METTSDFIKQVDRITDFPLNEDRIAEIADGVEGILLQLREFRKLDLSNYEPSNIFKPVEIEHEE